MVCVSGVHSVAVGMRKTNMFLVEQQLNEEKVCNQVEVINTNVTDHSGLHKAISRLLSVTLNSILGQKLQTPGAYQQVY